MPNPSSDDMKALTMEQLVDMHEVFKQNIEEVEAGMSVVKDELLDRLTALKVSGTKVGTRLVQKIIRTTYQGVELSTARKLGAIKMVEKVDETKLRDLTQKGIEIAGTKRTAYIKISEAE